MYTNEAVQLTMENLAGSTMAVLGCQWPLAPDLILHTATVAHGLPLEGAEFLVVLKFIRGTKSPRLVFVAVRWIWLLDSVQMGL